MLSVTVASSRKSARPEPYCAIRRRQPKAITPATKIGELRTRLTIEISRSRRCGRRREERRRALGRRTGRASRRLRTVSISRLTALATRPGTRRPYVSQCRRRTTRHRSWGGTLLQAVKGGHSDQIRKPAGLGLQRKGRAGRPCRSRSLPTRGPLPSGAHASQSGRAMSGNNQAAPAPGPAAMAPAQSWPVG